MGSEAVFACLAQCLAADPAVQRPAEAQLRQWEGQPGFCSALADIVAAGGGVDASVRFLAAVALKNAANRHWRPRRDGSTGVPEAEKAALRERALALADAEQAPQVALQLALLVARIARFDHPREWPQLLPTLAGALAGAPRARSYLLLHHVLKELASKRLASDQRAFEAAAAALLEPVWAHWCADTHGVAAALAAGAADATEVRERWRLETKVLHRLAVFGSPSDAKTLAAAPAAGRVAPALLAALPALGGAHAEAARGVKLLAALQAEHPWTFRGCGALRGALDAAAAALTADGAAAPPPPLRLRWTALLTGVLTCQAYRTPPAAGEVRPAADAGRGGAAEAAMRAEAAAELAAALPPDRASALAHALVTRHLLLSPAELAAWRDDPEAFHHAQAAADGCASDEPRPAAEALLLALVAAQRVALAPWLVPLLQQAAAACPADALPAAPPDLCAAPPALLAAEAAYCALGVCAYELHDHVDFGSWWAAALAPQLASRAPAGRPLRRRAAWLLGQWVAKLPEGARPEAYAALVRCLADEPDAAVRLAAANALRILVDDWGFSEEAFLPLAPAALDGLFRLAAGAEELDTAAQAFSAAACAVDRLGESVAPLAPAVLAAVPPLWGAGAGHALLRMQVLATLTRLVVALGPASPTAWPVVVPLLGAAADPAAPDADSLAEDALALWHATLRHAPSGAAGAAAAPLLPLLPLLLAELARSWEHLPQALRVLNSYILLDGGATLTAHGGAIAERLAAAVGAVNERGTLLLLPVADAALRAFPGEAPALLQALLQRLFAAALGVGADGTGEAETERVAAHACCLLGRVLLGNPPAFLALAASASAAGLGRGDALLAFVDAWTDKLDALASPGLRRLAALALCALLGSGHPHGVARLDDVAAVVSGVLAEEADARGGAAAGGAPDGYDAAASSVTWPAWDEAGYGDCADEGAEAERRATAAASDPAAAADVAAHFRAALAAAVAVHGREAVAATLGRVDAHLLAQLQAHTGPITL